MKTIMKTVFGVMFLLMTSSVCIASSQTGTVRYLIVRASDGLVYFELNGPARSGKPDCTAAYNYFMIKDENSGSGKRQHAMLLAAELAGKSVSIEGTNTCTRWGDGEDVNSVEVLP